MSKGSKSEDKAHHERATAFRLFLSSFETSRRGKAAWVALQSSIASYPQGEWIRWHALHACFWAARYKPETDSNYMLRRRDRAFRDNAKTYVRQLLALAKSLDSDRQSFDKVITSAALRSYVGLVRRPKGAPVRMFDDGAAGGYIQLTEQGAPLMERIGQTNFAQALVDRRHLRSSFALRWLLISMINVIRREGAPTLGKGPWRHRTKHGCLHFQTTIDIERTTLPSAHTMLVFNLVFLYRKGTVTYEPNYGPGWQTGEPMPTDGDPHWNEATQLANAVLNQSVTPAQSRDRIRRLISRNPGIGLGGWPGDE